MFLIGNLMRKKFAEDRKTIRCLWKKLLSQNQLVLRRKKKFLHTNHSRRPSWFWLSNFFHKHRIVLRSWANFFLIKFPIKNISLFIFSGQLMTVADFSL